ncbi:MAG: Holliday junction resolvase RuvX [Planctomycetes bacterium]|nr:Holliday junction resolvase RuvX [Planctomycetota bacterium]
MGRLGNSASQFDAWPATGRLAGIDYGSVRIGIALCDPSRTWTSPLETYVRKSVELDQKYFVRITNENQILGWVVGLPIHCDGRESAKSQEVRRFARWLRDETDRPVRFVDERYTTALATRMLRDVELTHKQRKKQLDKIAAHIILESYLESAKQPYFEPLPLEDV